ncbi:unnamed protein product [Rotaria socialis]|uniref:Uncharacterized protein n=1 Tax=Rotaria socialis TaxID=392032 RepID=A0A820TAL0_9BILA|nr:unnamed protein product [Rotaria socialis]CAF3507555.1 unnamed protein product [Rotaria socialis]CAF4469180.1 unnamed protein product [Rotaria socialis]CAF4817703.1 unnamed protein product [Rotaria socialis]
MNNEDKYIDLNAKGNNVPVVSKTWLVDDNISTDTNLEKELEDKTKQCANEFNQLCSDTGDYFDKLTQSTCHNIDQPTENPVNSSVDVIVSNDPCSASAASFLDARVNLLMYILHPILNIFRVYMASDFRRKNIRTDIPKLKDCLGNIRLSFGPISELADGQVECTIVFKGPNEQFYYAPYAFVRGCDKGYEFENPTIFDLKEDATIENNFVSLEMVICKLRNNMFECEDEKNNETCQIKRFLCGTLVQIKDEFSSLWEKNGKLKTKKTKPITPTKLAKRVELYTAYIMIRRTRFDPVENKFVPEPEILFCSNAFTPKNSSVQSQYYDYSANKLIITKVMQSRAEPHESSHQFNVHVSYVIPPLYECTQLRNKCIKVDILTGSKQESQMHPNYKFMADEEVTDSLYIRADKYESIATFKIVNTTRNQCNGSYVKNTDLPVSHYNGSDSMIQRVSFNEPSMNSFRVRLQLCDYTDQTITPYPYSTVQSTLVVDDFVSSERSVTSSSPANENVIIENIFESSVTDKRSLEKEAHERTGSPLLKTPKIHNSSACDS